MSPVCGFLEPGVVTNAFLCDVAVRKASFEHVIVLARAFVPHLIAKKSAIAARFRKHETQQITLQMNTGEIFKHDMVQFALYFVCISLVPTVYSMRVKHTALDTNSGQEQLNARR